MYKKDQEMAINHFSFHKMTGEMSKSEITAQRERNIIYQQNRRENIKAGSHRQMTHQAAQNSANFAQLYLEPMTFKIPNVMVYYKKTSKAEKFNNGKSTIFTSLQVKRGG